MVKAVQAEEGVESYFDGLLKNRVQAELGILVGKAGVGSRDIVLVVVPTPTQEGEQALTISEAAAKPAKKGKPSEPAVHISLDAESKDWVAAHAQQVAKMLPGGLSVLGLYLFAPESGYSSASSQLCEVLLSIAADASTSSGSTAAAKAAAAASAITATCTGSTAQAAAAELPASRPQELLLLHVDSASRKFTARSCSTSSSTAAAVSSLKPCDFKFGPFLPQLLCLRCCHSFNLELPAAAAGGAQMQQLLQDAARREAARVLSAVAAVNGRVLGGSGTTQAVADALPASVGSDLRSAACVELYCLPEAAAALVPAASSTSSGGGGLAGTVRLHGSLEALAYVHKRDPISKALAELKADVVRSLTARIQLLAADAADAAAEAAEAAGADAAAASMAAAAAPHPLLLAAGAGKRVRCGLPCRVLLPWEGLNLQVCDYLSEGESAAAAADRAQQLLHLKALPSSAVVLLEGPAVKKQKVVGGSVAGKTGTGGSGMACSAPVLAAAGAAVLAAAIGVASLSLG